MFSLSTVVMILSTVLSYTVLYGLLRGFVLKWILNWCFGPKLQVSDQQQMKSDSQKVESTSSHITTEEGILYITEGDMAKIANLSVSIIMAVLIAVMSLLIMWETKEDVIHAQSSLVVPFGHFGTFYIVCDTYTYYKAFVIRKKVQNLTLHKRLLLFVKMERAVVIHHLVIIIIGYPIACHRGIRRDLGDFFIGAFFSQDMSNPFQHMAIILRMLKQQQSRLYFLNGVILIPVYFVVRILNLPLTFLLFTAQTHNWNFVAAIKAMYPICHTFNAIQITLQLVWFTAIVRIAIRAGMLKLPGKKPTEQSSKDVTSHTKID